MAVGGVTWLLVAGAASYGLAIGSFLNVVIHRVPLRQSVTKPPSSCPNCSAPIAPRDNVPVLSWIALRGRCRACHQAISVRYPLVEVLTAGLFVVVALRFGWSWSLPAELAFVAGLVALAFCDLDHFLLPKRIVYPTGVLVLAGLLLATVIQGSWHRLWIALAAGGGEFLVMFAINALSPRALGFGDVRLGAVLGLALGWLGVWPAFLGFFLANLIGAVIGVALIATRRATRRTPIPYGVFLAIGAVLALAAAGVIPSPGAA